MFKYLRSLFNQKSQDKNKKISLEFLLSDLTEPLPATQYQIVAGEKGRATWVRPTTRGVEVFFERKIEASDVKDGKLLPVVLQKVKQRGGKRITGLTLTYESAEELNQLLEHVLKKHRRRRIFLGFLDHLWSMEKPT